MHKTSKLVSLVAPPSLRGMMWWTWHAGGRLEAAGGGAVPVPGDDGAAQVRRDRVGRLADVQGQADRPGGRGELAGAQPGREAVRARTAARPRSPRSGRVPGGGPGPGSPRRTRRRSDGAAAGVRGCRCRGSPLPGSRRRAMPLPVPPPGRVSRAVSRSSRSWSTCPVTIGTMVASHSAPGTAAGPGSTGAGALAPPSGVRRGHSRSRQPAPCHQLAGLAAGPLPGSALPGSPPVPGRPGSPACRLTGRAGPLGRVVPGRVGRAGLRAGPAHAAEQVIQAHVDLDLGGLPGPVRHHPGRDQPPARLLQRVVVTLPDGAGVLGPRLLAQGIQDGLERLGAAPGQVTIQAARAAQGGPHPAPAGPRTPAPPPRPPAQPPPHLPRQRLQVRQLRAPAAAASKITSASSRAATGSGSVQSQTCRAHDAERAPAPARRGPPGEGEPPHPPDRRRTRAAGDPGLPPQPRPRRPLTVIGVPALGRRTPTAPPTGPPPAPTPPAPEPAGTPPAPPPEPTPHPQ